MDKKIMLENLVREAYEKGLFNGAWLYAEHGEIISKGAVGFRDPEDKLPMQEDSIFDLASVSKQFTAAAIMLLLNKAHIGEVQASIWPGGRDHEVFSRAPVSGRHGPAAADPHRRRARLF